MDPPSGARGRLGRLCWLPSAQLRSRGKLGVCTPNHPSADGLERKHNRIEGVSEVEESGKCSSDRIVVVPHARFCLILDEIRYAPLDRRLV